MKVILITLHGARIDGLGAYGGSQAATPNLDRLAAQSVVFDQHFAGMIQDTDAEADLNDAYSMTLDELTAALTTNNGSSAYFADLRVIQHLSYSASWKHVGVVTDHDLPVVEQPTLTDGVLQHGIDWLQQYGKHYHRWLLNLELGALLPPWREEEYAPLPENQKQDDNDAKIEPIFEPDDEEPAPANSRFGWRVAYHGVMRYVDDLLGQFLKLVDELELTKDCLLIVQSSGGLSLGEHGSAGQRTSGLLEERSHLPLLIRFPHGTGAGRRVHHFTQPEDVLLTVYQSLLGEAPTEIQGDHLVRHTQGQAGCYREYAVTVREGDQGQILEGCLRTKHWSLVTPLDPSVSEPTQLYRKPEDRWDMNNVVKEHPDVAEHLELTLRRWLAWKGTGSIGSAPELRDEVTGVVSE